MRETLILAGPDELANALNDGQYEECRTLLLPGARYPDGAHELLRSSADALGARLYVPPDFAPDAPKARVVIECSPFGRPLAERLRLHQEAFGPRAAALVRPVALEIVLPPQEAAVCVPLVRPALDADGVCLYSETCCCAYLVSAAGDGWRFTLFDTARTIARRRVLCRRLGLECVMLTA